MTVSSTVVERYYTATVGQTVFPTDVVAYQDSDIEVYLNGTKLQSGTDYTATFNGGVANVTLTNPANAGDEIGVISVLPGRQEVDLINKGTFDADELEAQLDRLAHAINVLERELHTAMRFSRVYQKDALDALHLAPADRANRLLGFDGLGNLSINPGVDTGIPVGKQTIWVPGMAFEPMVNNPANGPSKAATDATGNTTPDLGFVEFQGGSNMYAQVAIALPKSWGLGDITVRPLITVTSDMGANQAVVEVAAASIPLGGNFNTANFGAATAWQPTGLTAGPLHELNEKTVVLPTKQFPSIQILRVSRLGGMDSFAGRVRLMGMYVHFITTAGTDA